MGDQKSVPPPRKRRGLRIVGIIVAVLLLLLVVAFFVGTSESFLKSVILPKLSKSMNATITTEHASISPFSHVHFQNLKVVTTGSEPLLTAQDVDARYALMKIIRGDIVVQSVELASPVINIVQNPDGSSNLDPLTKGSKEQPNKPSKESKQQPSKQSKPPQVDIQKVVLNNGTLRQTKLKKGGREITEISGLNVTLNNLQNGQNGKFQVTANIALNNTSAETNGTLQAKLNGNFDFALKPDLAPASVKGNSDFAVQNASGSFNEVSGLSATLAADLTPTDLREVLLRFQKAGNTLGQLRASGPFDASKQEGKITVEVASIDRQVLNLVGASKGIDFGSTVLNSTNRIDLAQGGALITVAGQLTAAKLTVKKQEQTTPTLDFQAAYDLTLHRDDNFADVRTFNLNGTQNQKQLLRGELASPMKISFGTNSTTAGDSAFTLNVSGLNLADWKPFLGNNVSSGTVGLNLKVSSQQSGKQLRFDVSSQLQNISATVASNTVSNVSANLAAQGSATDLKQFDLAGYKLDVTQQGQPMLSVSGAGQYNAASSNADIRVTLDANLPVAIRLAAQTNANASSGKLGFNGHILQSGDNQTFTGNLALADFTGRYGAYQFDRFGTVMDVDVSMKGKEMLIRKADGKITSGANQGGAFNLAGNYDTGKKAGQFDVKMNDVNQNALRPFLESMLHDKKLQSVSLNSTASTRLNGDNADIKTDVEIANLVVVDPKNNSRQPALEAKFHLDAGMENKVLSLRQAQANLTPTAKGKNELQLTGKIDMSNSNAMTGNLKLSAESLDVTRYYDLFSGKTAEEQARQTPKTMPDSPGEAAPPKPQKEPDPVKLPVQNFVVDASIGRFYLRELEVTNLATTVKLGQSSAVIDPFQLSVNGAPVSSKVSLDLSVPGYRYNINFDARQVPLEPMANSFVPEKRGMYKGNLIAQMQINGAGVTGTSMKKSLGGQFTFNFTNANIQIVNPQLRGFLTPIAVFLGVPDLLNSPVNQVVSAGQIANGKISLSQLRLVSEAFLAESKGDIAIADDLMQSTFNNWPMHFSIRSSLAQKIRIAPQAASPGQPYAALPDFIQVAGTLKSPKPKLDLNTKAIAGTVLDQLGGKLPQDKGGNIAQGLKGILGGNTSANPAATNTANQAAGTSTNSPQTNAPTGLNPLNLLDQFRRKK